MTTSTETGITPSRPSQIRRPENHHLNEAFILSQALRRAERRAQKIKMRLGGSNDPLEPFPQKPRRMHWRTYRRLRDQANAATAEADDLLAESMLGQFLDPVPPCQKRQRGRRDGAP